MIEKKTFGTILANVWKTISMLGWVYHSKKRGNCPIRGIMLIINRPLVMSNNNDEHYEALVKRQRMIRTKILLEIMLHFCGCLL